MDRKDALEKIRKCLALSESSNENEARTALIMARKLMATYKIGEKDLERDVEDKEPVSKISSVTYTTIRDNWMPNLIQLISSRFCCRGYSQKEYGKKTRNAAFIGFPSDVDICTRAFEYTVNCIRYNSRKMKLDKDQSDSYARGFIQGLDRAYKDQDDELEAALCDERSLTVLMGVPHEVNAYSDRVLSTSMVKLRKYRSDMFSYSSGYSDGRNHINKRIKKSPERITSDNGRRRRTG